MNSKSNNKLNFKEYLFLIIGLFLFFLAGSYLQFGGNIPKDNNLIFAIIIAIALAIPIIIYALKKLNS